MNYANAAGAFSSFSKSFRSFFSGPKLNAQYVPLLEKVLEVSGERSLAGKMASEFLSLK